MQNYQKSEFELEIEALEAAFDELRARIENELGWLQYPLRFLAIAVALIEQVFWRLANVVLDFLFKSGIIGGWL